MRVEWAAFWALGLLAGVVSLLLGIDIEGSAGTGAVWAFIGFGAASWWRLRQDRQRQLREARAFKSDEDTPVVRGTYTSSTPRRSSQPGGKPS